MPGKDNDESKSLVDRVAKRALATRHQATMDDITNILDCALAETVRRTPEAPRVADIAAAAGISTQTFYKYFRSKDEVIMALQERGSAQLVSYLAQVMEKEEDPLRQVSCWVEGFLRYVTGRSSREARAVLLQASRTSPHELLLSDTVSRQEHQLLELLETALHRFGSEDPQRAAQTIGDTVFGMWRRCLLTEEHPTPADIAHVSAFCTAGVSAEPVGLPPRSRHRDS